MPELSPHDFEWHPGSQVHDGPVVPGRVDLDPPRELQPQLDLMDPIT